MEQNRRLIDADELNEKLWILFNWFGQMPCYESDRIMQQAIKKCMGEVDRIHSVDAVEVVRCKDCMYYEEYRIGACGIFSEEPDSCSPGHIVEMEADGFCSRGERKDNET